MTFKSFEIFENFYEKRKEIGRGKFGIVFQVKGIDGKFYAAKIVKTRKETVREKVISEINLLSQLHNPHIIRYVDAFEKQSEISIVMEYLDGGELFERVAVEEFNLTESDCCLFLRQICRGVEYLHSKNILHLDLKPENIVCTERNGEFVKIVDFGTAMVVRPGDRVKVMCGTPEFIAPEIVTYDHVTSYTDMWAVGVITYILLSGFSPFMGESDSETYTNISRVMYDFELEEFEEISNNAKDFIAHLLMKSGRNRLTATQCLDHPWLLEQEIGTAVIKTENLRKYLARRRWQRCGQAIRAMKRMSSIILRRRSTLDSTGNDPETALDSPECLSRQDSMDISTDSRELPGEVERIAREFPSVVLRTLETRTATSNTSLQRGPQKPIEVGNTASCVEKMTGHDIEEHMEDESAPTRIEKSREPRKTVTFGKVDFSLENPSVEEPKNTEPTGLRNKSEEYPAELSATNQGLDVSLMSKDKVDKDSENISNIEISNESSDSSLLTEMGHSNYCAHKSVIIPGETGASAGELQHGFAEDPSLNTGSQQSEDLQDFSKLEEVESSPITVVVSPDKRDELYECIIPGIVTTPPPSDHQGDVTSATVDKDENTLEEGTKICSDRKEDPKDSSGIEGVTERGEELMPGLGTGTTSTKEASATRETGGVSTSTGTYTGTAGAVSDTTGEVIGTAGVDITTSEAKSAAEARKSTEVKLETAESIKESTVAGDSKIVADATRKETTPTGVGKGATEHVKEVSSTGITGAGTDLLGAESLTQEAEPAAVAPKLSRKKQKRSLDFTGAVRRLIEKFDRKQ